MKKRLCYIQPGCELELDYCFLELLCQSPENGGLEGIDYEDWAV